MKKYILVVKNENKSPQNVCVNKRFCENNPIYIYIICVRLDDMELYALLNYAPHILQKCTCEYKGSVN